MATTEGFGPATSQPDLMNDPAYATNTEGKSKIVDDPDTCRICRGEGSKEEPLFYPCKCSGSIKFVHQNCLMEWLSHSQKKHCELCKTPFRFTKLYHPEMPRTLPTPIFLRQVLIHTFRSLVTWSRFILVTFIWLGWLPWTMRAVWRGLFWLGDGGWADLPTIDIDSTLAAQHRLTELATNGTSPAGQAVLVSKEAAASAVVSGMANIIPHILSPISQTLNLTAGEPTAYRIAKGFLFNSFGRLANPLIPSGLYKAANLTENADHRHPSWLSNVTVLKTLTRPQFLNNLLIDTLEGQLITLLVVIAFVLVFLIREWVVQQQPGINMGAGFNAEAAEREADVGGALQQPARQHAQPILEHLRRPNDAEPVDDLGNPAVVVEGVGVLRPRVMARPRARRRIQAPPAEGQAQLDDHPVGLPEQDSRPFNTDEEPLIFGNRLPEGEVFRFGSGSEGEELHAQQRPSMPTKNALARAAEIQRTIDEEVRASGNQNWPGLQVFMDLWQRADSKPEQVLKIIEDEHRSAELGWIVSAMKRLQNVGDVSELPRTNTTATVPESEVFEDEQTSDGSSQSWQDVPRPSEREVAAEPILSDQMSKFSAVAENLRDNGVLNSGRKSPNINPSRAHSTDVTEAPVSKGKGRLTDALTLISNGEPHENLTTKIAKIEPNNTCHTTLADGPGGDHISEASGSSEDLPSKEINSSEKSTEFVEGASLANPFNPDHAGRASPQERHDAYLAPDDSLPATREDSRPQLRQEHHVVDDVASASQGLTDKIMAWLWGGVAVPEQEQEPRQEVLDENDEHVVQNIAEEAPFVPVIHGQRAAQEVQAVENLAQDPEVAAAAAEAGLDPNDQDAIEEGEDLEGVMELIGMQGPLTGLFQNGMFSAVLISTTVAAGIWLPYIWGKMVLLLLANPLSMMIRLPLRWLSSTADIIVDVCIFFVGCLIYWIDTGFRLCLVPVGMVFPSIARLTHHSALATAARGVAEGGLERLAKMVVATSNGFSETEFPIFSIVSHEALHAMEAHIANGFKFCFYLFPTTLQGLLLQTLRSSDSTESLRWILLATARELLILGLGKASNFVGYARSILTMNPLSITLEYPRRTVPLDYSLAYWDTKDRFITILLGYAFFTVAGFMYLKISGSFAKAQSGEKVAGFVAEILQQAGGVIKVILIISIEMIVFPLYCGLLLDAALLPLFENVTIMSRVKFTLNSPSTSLFVHWFVGTCYMFHFALFVSMCRKIMRNGVLCKPPSHQFRAD